MARERENRRLAAILATDMVDYTRLMEVDERGTIVRQKRHRQELIDRMIASHNGRIVKSTGDGLLVEFASVVDATECAAAVQAAMVEREQAMPAERRIQYRAGVNLGDIVIDGEDIFGDGVNVAVRLEGIAEPGGIVVSGGVYEIVRSKVDLGFHDLGFQKVKNIVEPIRAYKILAQNLSATTAVPRTSPVGRAHADRPSVVVLPFANPSGDPEQEYFADGITEDLITDLSKVSGLFVIGRNSSFALKGASRDTREIGRELGVRHILEGSVRRFGERVRINAQLVEVETRGQLWAERFDGDFADIFSLQDDINDRIVASLRTHLVPLELSGNLRQPTNSPAAYDLFLRGRAAYYRYTQNDMVEAQAYFKQAIEKDPLFGQAYEFMAHCLTTAYVFAWRGSDDNLKTAVALAEKSIALDENSAIGHARLGWIQGYLNLFDEATANFERAISLEPRSAEAYYTFGETMNKRGQPERGLPLIEQAFSIDSIVPPSWDFARGHSLVLMKRLDEATSIFENVVERAPHFLPAWVQLARAYSERDRSEEAGKAIAAVQELAPHFSLTHARKMFPYEVRLQKVRLRKALQAAGADV